METARSVLKRCLEHQPESRVNVFPFRSNLGRVLLAAKDFEAAEREFLDVERALSNYTEAIPSEIARVHSLLVELYDAWDKPEDAKRWLDQ